MIRRHFLLPSLLSLSFVTGCGSSDRGLTEPGGDESAAGASGAPTHDGMGGEPGSPAAGSPSVGGASGGDAAAGAGSDPGGRGGEAGEPGATATLSKLAISPSEPVLNAELGGTTPPLPLTARATWSDGGEQLPADGAWSSDRPEVATVDENGAVTATGNRGGIVKIRYRSGAVEAIAIVHVKLTAVVIAGSVQPEDPESLDTGVNGNGSAPAWQYPEDGTVFPARMTPPVFQWAASGNGFFKLELAQGDDVRVSVYTSQSSYQPSPEVWAALAADYGKKIELSLFGKSSKAADSPKFPALPRSVSTADADLPGVMYFFDIPTGKLSRMDLGKAKAAPLVPGDPTCRSCHSPSRDGSLLAFEYDGGGSGVAGLLKTADASEAFPKGSPGKSWNYATIRPDSLGMVTANAGGMKYWSIASPAAGVPVAQGALDVGTAAATQPTWSPDGSTLAFVARDKGSSDWAFEASDLRVATWNRVTQAFGAATVLTAAEAIGTATDTFSSPSWSPDSRYLAAGLGDKSYHPSNMALTLVSVADKTRQALSRASAHGVNEAPSFAPRAQGGYYWLAFVSNRSYGSATGQRLLWVTAVDQNSAAPGDPSHPAFLVPEQDPSSSRLLPQWAPQQCGGRDATCSRDAECCEGLTCAGSGSKTCQAVQCEVLGGECETNADCCAIQDVTCRAGLDGVKVCQR